jgi:hypothetical protein
MLRSINKQPRIAAHKKYTEKVVRDLADLGIDGRIVLNYS